MVIYMLFSLSTEGIFPGSIDLVYLLVVLTENPFSFGYIYTGLSIQQTSGVIDGYVSYVIQMDLCLPTL